jgi:hypothetical protein
VPARAPTSGNPSDVSGGANPPGVRSLLEPGRARRINAARGRRGKLFAHRYHARYLKSPREVRNALRYVLLNRRHHAAEKRVERALATTQAPRFSRYWIDPCSSAAWFDGWAQPIRPDEPWKRALLAMTPPTLKPTVWLLTTGWKRHGLLHFDEVVS